MIRRGGFLLFCFCLIAVFLVGVGAITGEAITGDTITGKASDAKLNASVTIYSLVNFSILSPLNQSYIFPSGSNISLDLNISYVNDSAPIIWTFTLKDLWLNTTINSSASFEPNTTIYPNRRSHNLTVSATNPANVSTVHSVIFYIDANNSAPVIDISTNDIYICENNSLAYDFNVSDNEGGGVTLALSPLNPYYLTPEIFYTTIYEAQIFSGNLGKDYVGRTELTVSASDGESSDVKKVNATVIELNNAPSVETLGVKTVWAVGTNREFYEVVDISDLESGNRTSGNFSYNLTFLNGVTPFFNISSLGIINFTANESYLGSGNSSQTYNLTLCVTDQALASPHQNISLCGQTGTNQTSCQNWSLTTTAQNRAPVILNYYPALTFSAASTDNLYFNITDVDYDGTIPDTYWYVDNNFAEYDAGSNVDEFNYGFGCGASGLHTVSVEVTDGSSSCYESSCNDSLQWVVVLTYVACPSLSPSGGGGGGGGGGGATCSEKWSCDPWEICHNAEKGLQNGELSGENYREITERCDSEGFLGEFCGYQFRDCYDANNCSSRINLPDLLQACYFTEEPTCSDGIKNCHEGDCEFLVDCGGPCGACPTCSDGIQNQGEYGVDCGGPCPSQCALETPLQTQRVRVVVIGIGAVAVVILLIKIYSVLKAGGFLMAAKPRLGEGI